ncbi:hypothetical protein GIB67_007429 [Kingdonia uniflora]|uniref:Uncharacterized protein n=1 Tax=Kingdonia uniflora TaxID=39325 RepID=A0A7J7MLT6_9MAGN|nr:hypothetical protein GIB67_007429 [Kingdonia uniflora]
MSSSKFTNNIAISITDDDSDELLQGRRTARARRKRKKLGFRARNSVLKRAFRNLMRYYWVVLMFIGGVVFFFEGVKIFGKSGGISNEGAITKMAVEKKAEGNLNRLDRTTRMFNGARELCLKLQPPEALEHLDIPAVKEPYFPVNRVIYKSDDDTNNIEGDATIFERNGEATRFNLFTGNQTIREREQSFKVFTWILTFLSRLGTTS